MIASAAMPELVGLLQGDTEPSKFGRFSSLPVAIVERQTVRVWPAEGVFTAASATVATRYWGVPPREVSSGVTMAGGDYLEDPVLVSSCGPSRAKPLGETSYTVFLAPAGIVPVQGEVTEEILKTNNLKAAQPPEGRCDGYRTHS